MLQLEYASSRYGSPPEHLTRAAMGNVDAETRRFERLFSAYKAA